MRSPRTGPAAGRRAAFTADDAVRAALDLGIADFTMGGVARTLGVTTPALYRLFPGRVDLVDACFRHIFSGMPTTSTATTWREILEEYAETAWDLFTRYPGLDRVHNSFPGVLREVWPWHEVLHRRLAPLGYSLPQCLFVAGYLGCLTTAATARLHRRTVEIARPPGTAPPPRVFRTSGTEITGPDDLAAASHRHWRQCVDLFLDRLAVLDPDWPAQSGPSADPR